ncbi:alpha-(1,3)-fucosyltransferase C-like [Eriocheir sinensis]|uniref:alpha-(1,3)-fucosyltransferase C-like n=1 Tax=Eriocheir sinensis TaxID=95602 RepID=UPI0021C82D78|nr:alpha-(1,3)-fucosyltransferase C-like [Eriocheir sinensis]
MLRVARARRALLWLGAAGVCVAAGRVLWVLLFITLEPYFVQHASHASHHLYGDLPTLNKQESPPRLPGSSTAAVGGHNGEKVVLFWTTWFGKAWWVRLGGGVDLQAGQCPETRCVFTHDRSRQHEASAVLFQSEGVAARDLPRSRESWQRWVWVHVEAPPYSTRAALRLRPSVPVAGAPRDLSGLFNWTMTYHPASDIMEPYGALLPLSADGGPDEPPPPAPAAVSPLSISPRSRPPFTPIRPALLDATSSTHAAYLNALHHKKTLPRLLPSPWPRYVDREPSPAGESWRAFLTRPRLVAWMSSHCYTASRREEYVRRLQQHVAVDVYGTCGPLRCSRREKHRDDSCWREVIGVRYLFYLAFENALCDAYVTEKVWRPLVHGLVPVVLGGANYSAFLPHKSFINAGSLGPLQLAHLLLRLQKNPREYAEYHLWRAFWRPTLRPPLCELCLRLHNSSQTTTQQDLDMWWRGLGRCRPGH